MTITKYHNVEDVYVVVRQLRDKLLACGEEQAAKELDETMSSFWTTSSAALGEIKFILLKVRPIAEKVLDKETLGLLDSAIKGATKLWNGN